MTWPIQPCPFPFAFFYVAGAGSINFYCLKFSVFMEKMEVFVFGYLYGTHTAINVFAICTGVKISKFLFNFLSLLIQNIEC